MWFIFGGRLPQTRGVFSTVLLKSVAVCLYAHGAARRHFYYALGHLWGGALISVPDVNTHRTPHSHPRAVWWRFQNDVWCVRSLHSAVLRVYLPRKVKVRLVTEPDALEEVWIATTSKIVRVLFSHHYSAASWRRYFKSYTIKNFQARAIKCCKKTCLHVIWYLPPRAIKIMAYFVKHPVCMIVCMYVFFKDISQSRALSQPTVVACCSPVNNTLHRHDIIRMQFLTSARHVKIEKKDLLS